MGIVLSGQLICDTEDQAARVRAHIDDHIRLTRAEPGCLSFRVNETDDPLIWQVDEEFVDAAAFDAHQARTRASIWAKETAGITRDFTKTETA
jgi:quinol monooxygenase YgiN